MTNEEWSKLKRNYYRTTVVAITDEGSIDFSEDHYREVEFNGVPVSYDEYLDIQRTTGGTSRGYFAMCFYNSGGYAECKGQIDGINEAKGQIVFHRIFVSGMYGDGTFFDGKENHVWMDRKGFEKYNAGDCLSFSAEVYRYLKTGNGKQLDYGLRNPSYVKQVENYELPSDDELLRQALRELVCETCMYKDKCSGEPCLAPVGYREDMVQMLLETSTHSNIE